jgi:DNA sulfur modification protein DndD
MLIKKVIFNDFRLYKGFNEINLSIQSETERNIILIGALNGSGKTSILEGILLALYGSDAKLTSGETYEQLIRESMNQDSYRNGSRKFFIEIEFENNEAINDSLVIRREWRISGKEISEEVHIKENERELKQFEDEIEKAQFIQTIVPSGIAQFFFFDGEKIQYMADDNDYEDVLTSSIRDILNINIYQQLVEDLISYEQGLKRSQVDAKQSDITKIEGAIESANEEILDIESKLDHTQVKMSNLQVEIKSIKNWLRNQGIGSIGKRANIQEELDELKQKRESVRDDVISYLDNEFPFALLYSLLIETDVQLKKEEEYNQAKHLSRQNNENFYELVESLNSEKIIPNLTSFQKEVIAQEMQVIWAKINKPIIRDKVNILHDLSSSELEILKLEINKVLQYLSSGTSALDIALISYENIAAEINSKFMDLKRLPTDENVLKKEQKLELMEEQEKQLENEIRTYQYNLDEISNKKKVLQNSRLELIEQVKVTKEIQTKIDESAKFRAALNHFIKLLTVEKAKEVELLLSDMFLVGKIILLKSLILILILLRLLLKISMVKYFQKEGCQQERKRFIPSLLFGR